MICKICNKEVFSYKGLATHLRCSHKLDTKTYYDTYLLKNNEDKCIECGKPCNFENLSKGYYNFCSKSCVSKHFPSNNFSKEETKNKIRETLLKRYGVDHSSKIPGINDKRNKTHLKKTGYDLYHDPTIIKKRIETRSVNDYTETYKKINEKKLAKFGNKCNYEKVKETIRTNHGVNNPFQSKEIMDACWKRYEERTGFDHPSHNPEVIKKIKQKYWYDNRFFDSSWEIAYYIWLKDHNIDFIYHPNISFNYKTDDGKEHRYFPDFKVNEEYIEIKGDHLLSEEWSSCEKIECIKTHVKILCCDEIKPILDYINEKYGKNYLKQFKYEK